jgi:hypothetical protein
MIRERHGMSNRSASPHPLYRVWNAMIDRCHRKKSHAYPAYGGRGITVCERWKKFTVFLSDMGSSWVAGLELDRINNNAGYSPENCRWATPRQQANNRRSNRRLTVLGRTMTLAQWDRASGLYAGCVSHRLRLGISPERAVQAKDLRFSICLPR